ncbi:hypothetical protein MZM54_02820 [[Brevibacterium] frigoritolerans]|nr:hypothetical protein [Peribacillus frigoritolerans]
MIKNKFDIKANEIEKKFFRKLKSGSSFLTGNGHKNNIVGHTDKAVYVKTAASKDKLSISRKKVKEAIAYLLYTRTATRKDLERFASYNSALMGLLRLILVEMAKINKTVSGLLRLTIIGVRFFFSGLERPSKKDFNAIKENGALFILNSYFSIRDRGGKLHGWMEKLRENNLKLLMDSGAFSLFNAQIKGKKIVDAKTYDSLKGKQKKGMVKEITLEAYAEFINLYKHLIFGFFNLDVIGDAEASNRNFQKLKELTGEKPIPVWHCNVDDWKESDWTLLNEMVEEDHEIIAIGATVELGRRVGPKKQNDVKRELYKEIFKRHPHQNFHLLGGSGNHLLEFPFFSADSSGWLQGRKKHQIYSFEDREAATKVMKDWSKEKCLAFNVKSLSSLEDIYDGIQMELDLTT